MVEIKLYPETYSKIYDRSDTLSSKYWKRTAKLQARRQRNWDFDYN